MRMRGRGSRVRINEARIRAEIRITAELHTMYCPLAVARWKMFRLPPPSRSKCRL